MDEFRGGDGIGEGQLLILCALEVAVVLRAIPSSISENVYDDGHILQR